MNGRCETDPLDKAVDVCDRCYGEFCDSHLLHPKGRKYPLCSECALVASGVRGNSKVVHRGDRKTAKKRRKQLLEAAASGETQFFEFFDQEARSAEQSAVEAATAAASSDDPPGDSDDGNVPIPDFDEVVPTAKDSPDSKVQSVEETPPTPAVAQLEQLRKEAEAKSTPSRDDRIAPSTDSTPSSSTSGDDIPAELLERRKSFGTEHSTLQPDVGGDGLAPLPNRQSTRPVAPPPERAPAAASDKTTATNAPSSRELPAAEDRRRPTPPPTHRRPTAPMIGEVRNVAGRRSDDAQTETGDGEPSAGPETNGPAGTLNAVDVFDADRQRAVEPETKADSTEPPKVDEAVDSDRADVDSQGNWIPPVLRGIAPDAAEAKANLPQRPRR